MVLPQSYVVTLIVMIFGMLCLGSWANTFKLGGKWRFELYYFDFAFGVLFTALLLAFTIGSSGFDGFSFMDDLMHAGKRQWFYAFLAGMLFNLANMLLIAAISVTGMAVAYIAGIGTAVVFGSLLSLVLRGGVNPLLLLPGCLMIIVAIVAAAFAHSSHRIFLHELLAKAGKAKSTRRPSSAKGIILCVFSGLMMGIFPSVLQQSTGGELGLGPYAIGFLFALGIFVSTLVYDIFFINLPVEGEPAEMGEYFKVNPKFHLAGFSGGVIWTLGFMALLLAAAVPPNLQLSPSLTIGLGQGFAVIAALFGLLVWQEFKGTDQKLKLTTVLMVLLFLCGLMLLSLAPLSIHEG